MTKINNNLGFTLLEVTLALFLLGAVGLSLAGAFADQTRYSRDRDWSMMADQIALNEIERLRATHPWTIDWVNGTTEFYADRLGNVVTAAEATYHITIAQSVRCDGGPILVDNLDAVPFTAGCEAVNNLRPTAHYSLSIIHPSELSPEGMDTLTRSIQVGPVGRFASGWAPATAR